MRVQIIRLVGFRWLVDEVTMNEVYLQRYDWLRVQNLKLQMHCVSV